VEGLNEPFANVLLSKAARYSDCKAIETVR
jgi:hypothetical protein